MSGDLKMCQYNTAPAEADMPPSDVSSSIKQLFSQYDLNISGWSEEVM